MYINRLTIKFKDASSFAIEVPNWNDEKPTHTHWTTLFDWFQHSGMETFLLCEDKDAVLLVKEDISLIYSQLVHKDESILPQPESWFKRVFTS